jgi:hypothetical protein
MMNADCNVSNDVGTATPTLPGAAIITTIGPITKGWECPKCGRGVRPDEKYCDHNISVDPFISYTPNDLPMCGDNA